MIASIENKQIKKIDKMLLKINQQRIGNKINEIFFLLLLIFTNFFFSDQIFFDLLYESNMNFEEYYILFLYQVFLKGIAILLATFSYLRTYMKIKENGRTISIYEKLKYTPINPENITFVRIGYLMRYTLIVLVIYIISNCLFLGGEDINVDLTILLILYSILVVLIFALLPGYLSIIRLNRKKGKRFYKKDINKNKIFILNILEWFIRIMLIFAILSVLYFYLLLWFLMLIE